MDREEIEVFGPSNSQLKFVYSKFEKSAVSWKKYWMRLAREKFGTNKAKAEATRIANANKKPTSALHIEVNENYAP